MNNYWTYEASDSFLIVSGRVTLPTHEWNFAGTVKRETDVSPAVQAARIVSDIVSAQEKYGTVPGFGGYGGFWRKKWEDEKK